MTVFTDPQVASVGLSESGARTGGKAVKTAVLHLTDVPRALVARDARGLFKMVAETETGRILGGHVIAADAGEVIQAATLAVRFGLRVQDLVETFHPYLTMVEGLKLTALTFKRGRVATLLLRDLTAREVRAHAADDPSAPGGPRRLWRVINAPETNVAVFAFLLNVPWEFLQMPLFASDPSAPKWEHLQSCTVASLGDAVIAVVSFWGVATAWRTRRWILQPTVRTVGLFAAIGVEITVVMEWLATGVLARWTYASQMPVIPGLGTGLLPVLQWIALPPLVVWFVRRQLT